MQLLRIGAGILAVALGTALGQGAAPNDAQIAAIVVTANQVDIDAGKFAQSHSTSKDVQGFAKLMVTDHGAVNKSAVDLATRLKLTPEDNPTAQSLKKGGEDNIANLKTLSGAAFDRAYIDIQVRGHESVLAIVQQALAINQPPAFANLLADAQSLIEQHLALALAVQGSLPE